MKGYKNTGVFNEIDGNYENLNHILSLGIDRIWRRKSAFELADTTDSMLILDAACGTGDMTSEISRCIARKTGRSEYGSRIIAMDISQEMMDICRNKAKNLKIPVEIVKGDCEDIPYENNLFDRVSIAFGIRNLIHLELGLHEMHRVLKPGGKLVITELSMPSSDLIRKIYEFYLTKILPSIAGTLTGNKAAYTYQTSSIKKFPPPDKIVNMLHCSGFRHVRHESYGFGICRMFIAVK